MFPKIKKIVLFNLLITILLCTYFIAVSNHQNNVKEDSTLRSKDHTKYILYWTPFWKWWDYQLGFGFQPFKNCKHSNCYATNNRTYLPLKKYDAFIFHVHSMGKDLPRIRRSHQFYIFMNSEAPSNIRLNLEKYNAYFNWTMTYRFDSDIVRRHGYFFKEETNYKVPNKKFIQNKTKLAAWFVSNCKTSSQREVLGKEIKKLIKVDLYGQCGNLKCLREKDDPKISSSECYDMTEENYKFYFSFENSYCKDYATEKLYNILMRNIVPVVYGGGDYKVSAPPNSVINVADFNNGSELANFLVHLDQNDKEYLKYFEWKKYYRLTRSLQPSACQLCKKLHKPLKESIYYDLHQWWWGKNRSMCKENKNLPKIVSDIL